MRYAGRITRVLDPITFEVLVDMGLGITYTCKVKMAGVKYRKYDKDDESEYENFLRTKDQVRDILIAKELIIEFITDYKDRSGKYLVDFTYLDQKMSKQLVDLGLLEALEF